MPVQARLAIVRQVAEGLAPAHEAGVVHRDLKPANILVEPDGQAYIIDFGIAVSSRTVNAAGVVVGTPEYMAPEQISGRAVDARADVYALGLLLYDMLTGRKRLQR